MKLEWSVYDNGTRGLDPAHRPDGACVRASRRPFAMLLLPTGKHPVASGSIRKHKKYFRHPPARLREFGGSLQFQPAPTAHQEGCGRLRKAAEGKKYFCHPSASLQDDPKLPLAAPKRTMAGNNLSNMVTSASPI